MESTPYFVRIIKSKLEERGVLNVDTLISILINTKSVIAGSFPLQCLLGEQYDDSDIDIFCKGCSSGEAEKIMIKNNYTSFPTLSDIDTYIYKTYSKKKGTPSSYIIDGIIRSKKYNINDKLQFNVIQVATSPMDFVKATFDFSFCQTIFDGINLHFYPLTVQKIGWRTHLALPRVKEKKPYHQTRSTDDIRLYPNEPYKILEEHAIARTNKYKQRGFMIYEIGNLLHLKMLFDKCQIKIESDVCLLHAQDDKDDKDDKDDEDE